MRIRDLAGAALATLGAVTLAGPAAAAAPDSRRTTSATDWLRLRTMNIAHQGGEAEAPSNTMYAYERALRLGADMLEVDVHGTADGHLVVLHDATVDRTTDGEGAVYDMTLPEVRRLDAAHDLVPGAGTRSGLPERSYPFRGVRTGERPPPRGFSRRDFRIPTLTEVMEAYSDVPINIEIKGRADTDQASFNRNADLLARTLRELGRTEGIIVASFNDAALQHFHAQMPGIDLAPGLVETALFKLGGVPPGPGSVAFQVPITFSGLQVADGPFVRRAHERGYAVHVWLSNDPENDATYWQLLGWDVDGIMAAEPAALERVLCRRGVPRPGRPSDAPGAHCRHRRASIACTVRPRGVGPMNRAGRITVRLRRRDDFSGRCAGRVQLRLPARLPGRRTARGRFSFGRHAPGEGGPKRRRATVRLGRRARRAVREGAVRARVRARPYQAFDRGRVVRVRAG